MSEKKEEPTMKIHGETLAVIGFAIGATLAIAASLIFFNPERQPRTNQIYTPPDMVYVHENAEHQAVIVSNATKRFREDFPDIFYWEYRIEGDPNGLNIFYTFSSDPSNIYNFDTTWETHFPTQLVNDLVEGR
jgi:hypothetical protein